jgi:hypothetical protein
MADQLRAAFPYPPYDIQQQFMINVVDTLDNRQIGLFESPTGTLAVYLRLFANLPGYTA